MQTSIKFDKNNIETGYFLPEDLRYYVDSTRYVHKYGAIASALKASAVLLS